MRIECERRDLLGTPSRILYRHLRDGMRSGLDGRSAQWIGCGPPSGSETTCADDLVASSGREDLPDVKPRFRG